MNIEPIYSLEAEKAVLGAVLINPEVFKFIDLSATDFYKIEHQEIWAAFQSIVLNNSRIDILTVKESLKDKEINLFGLIVDVPTSINAEYYAEIVRDKACRRDIVHLSGQMANTAYDQTTDLKVEIPTYMTRLAAGAKMATGAEHIRKALSELYDEINERQADPRDIWGIPTGLYDYDILTGGHHKGELTLLSGKPGLGKSLLAIQMAMGMASHSAGVIYEMEMGAMQTIRRSVANQSRVETRKMRNGKLAGDDWEHIVEAIAALEGLPVFMSDFTGWTTASMRADLARLKAQQNIEWFVVDYLYLLSDRYGRDDYERLAYISKSLKNICKDLDLSGLVIHSMNKSEMESNTPSLAGMRGSSQIAYDTDVAIYLLEDENSRDNVKLYFAKFREDTPDRYIRLQRDNGFPSFKSIEKQTTYGTPYKD